MADDSPKISQDEIERLLAGAQTSVGGAAPSPPAAATQTPVADVRATAAEATISAADIEALLNRADQALASIDQPPPPLPPGVRNFEFRDLSGTTPGTQSATLELMRDVQLDLTIELGRTHMLLEDVLKLQQGAVVPLDKLAGDPADIYVNGRLIARGEILVLNDNFCVRVAELIAGESLGQ